MHTRKIVTVTCHPAGYLLLANARRRQLGFLGLRKIMKEVMRKKEKRKEDIHEQGNRNDKRERPVLTELREEKGAKEK
jgi:hypothetical protein